MNRWLRRALLSLGAGLAAGLTGCQTLETVSDVGTQIAVSTGTLTEEEGESIRRGTRAVAGTFRDFTPEQEYYVGRSVGASILAAYPPYDNPALIDYLNRLGQALAMASDRPETFAGYHVLPLDSQEINAFAAPGGLIFVTRGMLRLCESEDEAAAVLAHEIAHVVHQHGLGAIKNSRVVDALGVLAAESARTLGGGDLAKLTDLFEGSVGDITHTLLTSGYAREQEREADAQAVLILRRIGYDPYALVRVLRRMETGLQAGTHGFASTHPPPSSRIAEVGAMLKETGARPAPSPLRQRRFDAAFSR